MLSQPQNPELRISLENFHPCILYNQDFCPENVNCFLHLLEIFKCTSN